MQILTAESAGFCFGVKKALDLAQKTLTKARETGTARIPVYSLGPLVHNPQVVQRLEEDGVKLISDLSEAPAPGYVIVRTHGISPTLRREITDRGFTLVDATCPLVTVIHHKVGKMEKDNLRVVVIGHKDHPEVKGILGYADDDAIVIESAEEIDTLPRGEKLGVVVQTTANLGRFEEISKRISGEFDANIKNTICFATEERQEAAIALAKEVEVMVVVGGRNSSNSCRLAEISEEYGATAYQVETADELQAEWFRGRDKVGLTAGASTPDWIIDDVRGRLQAIAQELEAGLPVA